MLKMCYFQVKYGVLRSFMLFFVENKCHFMIRRRQKYAQNVLFLLILSLNCSKTALFWLKSLDFDVISWGTYVKNMLKLRINCSFYPKSCDFSAPNRAIGGIFFKLCLRFLSPSGCIGGIFFSPKGFCAPKIPPQGVFFSRNPAHRGYFLQPSAGLLLPFGLTYVVRTSYDRA